MFCTEFNTWATTTKALQSTVILFTARMNCAEDLAWPVEDISAILILKVTERFQQHLQIVTIREKGITCGSDVENVHLPYEDNIHIPRRYSE